MFSPNPSPRPVPTVLAFNNRRLLFIMDVHLLIYDLSRGLARQMSMGFLGFQLDAIYHTSIQLQGREYVYDGGVVAITPGSSHLGQPMEKLHLGTTNLPMDVIEDYVESVRSIFTVEVCFMPHALISCI